MTAALMDIPARVEPARGPGTGAKGSEESGAGFDEAITEAVDRSRPQRRRAPSRRDETDPRRREESSADAGLTAGQAAEQPRHEPKVARAGKYDLAAQIVSRNTARTDRAQPSSRHVTPTDTAGGEPATKTGASGESFPGPTSSPDADTKTPGSHRTPTQPADQLTAATRGQAVPSARPTTPDDADGDEQTEVAAAKSAGVERQIAGKTPVGADERPSAEDGARPGQVPARQIADEGAAPSAGESTGPIPLAGGQAQERGVARSSTGAIPAAPVQGAAPQQAGQHSAQPSGVEVTQVPTVTGSTTNSTPITVTTPTPVPQQPTAQPEIAGILAQLRGRSDGTYQLRAMVHPAELGAVNITATISHGAVSVILHGDAQAQQILSQSLSQLRDHLADQGFTGVDVGLGSPDQHAEDGDRSGERHTQGSDHRIGNTADVTDDEVTAIRPRHAGTIDAML